MFDPLKILLSAIFSLSVYATFAQTTMPLYTDSVPNVKGVLQEQPTLTMYAPSAGTGIGTAVIVCPGGGYRGLSMDSEGSDIAAALSKHGITAFVLKYRLPSDDQMQRKEIGPLQDAQQAIKTVRSRAKEWKIDPARIGVMGFSAGGHLASTLGTHYRSSLIPNNQKISLRPDFLVLVYAVISFRDSLAHIGSRTHLIGEKPSRQQEDYYSNELQVNDSTPPTFLIHAEDDDVVKVENSIAFYDALLLHHIPAEMHLYQHGGHGFGIHSTGFPSADWMTLFFNWLNQRDLLKLTDHEVAAVVQEQARMEEGRTRQEEQVHKDWPFLKKYEQDNGNYTTADVKQHRIVFMGNSITEGWRNLDSAFFIENGYIDRGISGQTTPQMLVRFRPDVINLHANVVVILAGINDIAENTGPISLETTFGNIASMAELARANNIRVVISSVLPAYDFPWRPGLAPADKVVRLNGMLSEYAKKNGFTYLDYFSMMVDDRKGLRQELTTDGVHPTLAGYKVMEPLVQKAIASALSSKNKK